MGAKTNISWCQRTQNFWMGCKHVSTGCLHCYMFRDMNRYGLTPEKVVRTSNHVWGQPKRWQKQAAKNNVKEMVFTCSWSDFFIDAADQWRNEAWEKIKECPNLIFQILTKRPHRISKHLPKDWGEKGYPNVALGVSVENARYLCRMDILRDIPAHIRFVSAEPLLGPLTEINLKGYGWCICGGESGGERRPMKYEWAIELRDLCKKAGVPFFYKQGNHTLPGHDNELDGEKHENWPAEWLAAPLSQCLSASDSTKSKPTCQGDGHEKT